jgi:hypothetical protein
MNERRSTNRWQINKHCGIKLQGAEVVTGCYIRDISLKGLQVALRMKLPEDTFLRLSIFLHEKLTLDIEAWTVWHKTILGENYYGFYFSKIKDSDRERIYKFLCECLIAKDWWRGLTEEKEGDRMQDQRIFARIPVKFPMRYLEPNNGGECQAHTQDVSAKGIGLLTNAALSSKTILDMWIEIPDKNEPLYTRGEVVWSKMLAPNEFRVGLNLERAELMGLSRVFRIGQ